MTGINVSPNGRYYDVGDLPVGNGSVRVQYKDISDGRTGFEPYRISIYLKCELTDYDDPGRNCTKAVYQQAGGTPLLSNQCTKTG